VSGNAQHSSTQWGLFELVLNGPSDGNPYLDVELTAVFEADGQTRNVTGFYDGDGVYRLRFMPEAMGKWSYRTASNRAELDGVAGVVDVGPANEGDHGPVRAQGLQFRYADGSRYINLGTTAYAWNLQGDELEEQTLKTLAAAPFTKIRMCVFPKHYRYNENEPTTLSVQTGQDGQQHLAGNHRRGRLAVRLRRC